MNKESFLLGKKISKNFDIRGVKDTALLYEIIQDAVELVQSADKENGDVALGFLVDVYTPYVKKIAGKTFKKVERYIEYEDVLQEVYLIFIRLVNKHSKEKSKFSYYITFMLPQYMYVWSKKVLEVAVPVTDSSILEASIPHPYFTKKDAVYDFFDGYILENEYTKFIEKRALKKSRSATVGIVCNRYFLGHETCSIIASDLGISYHAVYEIINRIKKELKHFLHNSSFTGFRITSTGIKF